MNDAELRDLIANAGKMNPKSVYGQENAAVWEYRKILLRVASSVFKINGSPVMWDIDYLKTALLVNGYVCVTETEYGVVPLICGLAGQNLFLHPTTCIIANPAFSQTLERTIDRDCVLWKLQYVDEGIMPEINSFAYRLAAADASIDVNLLNSRVAFFAECGTKGQALTIQAAYTKMSKGEPCIVYKKTRTDPDMRMWFNDVKNNYVADKVQQTKTDIMNEFLTRFGINNANTDKRERLISDEVNANNEALDANIEQFREKLTEGCKKVNSMFSLNLSVEFPFLKGGDTNNITN